MVRTRGRDWDTDVKEYAIVLRRQSKTREEVLDELVRYVAENDMDPDGREPTMANVIDWTKDIRKDDAPWDFLEASPEEIDLVMPVYQYAASIGDRMPWPRHYEARWFVRIQTVVPSLREKPFAVFRLGRFAAGLMGSDERRLAMALMDYAAQREDILKRRNMVARVSTVPAPAKDEPQWGGTALADWDTARSDPFAAQGPATP